MPPSRFYVPGHIDVRGDFWHDASVYPLRNHLSALAALLPGLLFCVAAPNATAVDAAKPPLMSVKDVRGISPALAAKGLPVRLRAAITFCDARFDVGMFVRDDTGGIYIKLGEGTNNFNVGDQLEIEGRSGAGDFVPIVYADKLTVLGHAPLPAPDSVTYDQLATGVEDSQWVAVRGTIRAVVPAAEGHTLVEFLADGQRLTALVSHFNVPDGDKLIASVATVRGVCRTRFNNRRQIRAPFLSVTSSDDITVETPAPANILQVPLAQLFQFNPDTYYARRVEVKGVVAEQKGRSLFIQDHGAGLSVKTEQTNVYVPGDVVSVVGFPTVGQYSPVLEDAVISRIQRGAPPAPIDIRPEELITGDYDGELVRLSARLMNHVQRGDEEILVLEADNMILSARVDSERTANNFQGLQSGSELEVTGVCLTQPTENWNPSVITKPESFQLLLRSSNDVTVIRNPPWWTLSRLLWMLGIMSVVLLVGFAWVFVLDRRVRQQTAIIQQKLQREAVLEERTRIAREFHDTLEQELVAITIQLETVADQFDEAPQIARQMLTLARNMTRRSLFEARRSVWDLRSHLLENSTLVNAIGEVGKLMTASSRVPISVATSGSPHKLPPQVENNLLRITQEALANALKHARASHVNVSLDYQGGKVVLRIQDDGVGFDTNNSAIMYAGHFGLLDMSERAEKMGGTFSMVSNPDEGTEIIVECKERDEPQTGEVESLPPPNLSVNQKTEIA